MGKANAHIGLSLRSATLPNKTMRRIKINFRVKNDHGTFRTWKVYTSKRSPVDKKVRQIHIAYINESCPIPQRTREKITAKLQEKWLAMFGNKEVAIDWDDAEAKLTNKIELANTKNPTRKTKSTHAESTILYFLWQRETEPHRYHLPRNNRPSLFTISMITGISLSKTRDILAKLALQGFTKQYNEGIYVTSKGLRHLEDNAPELFLRKGK